MCPHYPFPKSYWNLNDTGTQQDLTIDINRTATWKVKKLKIKYKKGAKQMVKDKWKDKVMHGKFSKYLDKDHMKA